MNVYFVLIRSSANRSGIERKKQRHAGHPKHEGNDQHEYMGTHITQLTIKLLQVGLAFGRGYLGTGSCKIHVSRSASCGNLPHYKSPSVARRSPGGRRLGRKASVTAMLVLDLHQLPRG